MPARVLVGTMKSNQRDLSWAVDTDGQCTAKAGVHIEGLSVIVVATPCLLEHPRGGCPAEQPHLSRVGVATKGQG